MATVRLIVVLLVLGVVVLLGAQNLATALPLVFFGGSTQALPLGVWLVSAIALGAITTLALTLLLENGGGGGQNRSASYKYRPQSFYEPSDPSGRGNPPPYQASGTSSGRSPSASPRGGNPADDDPSWRAWTNLKSPGQWSDWESLSQAPNPETAPGASPSTSAAAGIIDGVTTWFSSSKQRAKQQQKINESLRELDDDWGDMENRPYRAPGVSPVQDSLDDIDQGWGGSDPVQDFEASQAPRRVYRDGSIYSYSYRDEADPAPSSGQVDNIYAPPDDVIYGNDYSDDDPGPYGSDYGSAPGYASGYGPDNADYADPGNDSYDGPDGDDAPLGEPEIAEDGVVDADYRVIVPPYPAAAKAAATWADGSDDAPGDDWDDADDALTP
ncbi:MAG: hypothetical protein ACFCVB_03395 [Nodosilinea sp.]